MPPHSHLVAARTAIMFTYWVEPVTACNAAMDALIRSCMLQAWQQAECESSTT